MTPIPEAITTLPARYDYPACWLFLDEKGKAIYGTKKFHMYPEYGEVIARLFVWALRDEESAHRLNIDLNKGIMLTGPVGCGKTSLMNLLRYFLPSAERHYLKPCYKIASEYTTEGYAALSRYSDYAFHPGTRKPVTICFDDLGLEPPLVYHYKNPCNTMAETLFSRHDYFISDLMLTHITTNLNSQEIEDRYGMRVRSRMRELFNVVPFEKGTSDKRK